nr:hypothetical protein GCM10020063_001910 [Dactylosporangium thailandense]
MTYEIFDPFENAPETVDVREWLEQQGWSEFLGIGGEESDLRIRSYRRSVDGRDEFIVEVWDAVQGSPFVKVDNFGVLMDLLARWAPAVQAASLTYLIDNLQSYSLSRDGVIETVAARAAFGANEGLEALRSHERQMAASRRRRREERLESTDGNPSEPA